MKLERRIKGKTARDGEVRCLCCLGRFWPDNGAERATCPECGIEYRISWPFPGTAKIRGPVWEKYPK